MLKHIIGIVMCCILHGSWVFTDCIDDHCTDAAFCNPDTRKAHPTDCSLYYDCQHGNWLERPCMPGTEFDIVGCICNYTEYVTCNWCNEIVTKVPISPGPCHDIPDPCVNGAKYPDRSDCQAYYECQFGDLVHSQCGYMVDKCTDFGTACAFDVYSSQCRIPDASFDCDYRCVTTALYMPTTEALTTLWPTTESITTLGPTTTEAPENGPCDNIPDSCVEGVKYPDRSNCQAYYVCQNGSLVHSQCVFGVDHCTDDGTACLFDVYTSLCIIPDALFNCDYRCLTTEALTTQEADENGDLAVYLVWALSFLVLFLIIIIMRLSCRLYCRKPVETVPNSGGTAFSSLEMRPPPPQKRLGAKDESKTVRRENTYQRDLDQKDSYQRLDARRPIPNATYDSISPQVDKCPPTSITDRGANPPSQHTELTVVVNPTYKVVAKEDRSGHERDDYLTPVYDKIEESYITPDKTV